MQGRIQDFHEGGSTCRTRAKRAKIFRTRLLFGEPRPLCAYASAADQSISKIYTKVSEIKSLLATIIVRQGVLLVHNRDFLVLEQRR